MSYVKKDIFIFSALLKHRKGMVGGKNKHLKYLTAILSVMQLTAAHSSCLWFHILCHSEWPDKQCVLHWDKRSNQSLRCLLDENHISEAEAQDFHTIQDPLKSARDKDHLTKTLCIKVNLY